MQINITTLKIFTISLLLLVTTSAHSFSTFGSAWNPGANTARIGGNPAPGGATWSIIGAGVSDASSGDGHGGALTTDLAALNPGLDIVSVIDNAFNTWAAVSNFTNLGQVADSGLGFGATETGTASFGDIRIGAIAFDGPFGTLAHGFQPGTENEFSHGSIAGDIHIDNAENWITGFDLATVLLHEVGHALGLAHSNDINSVMFSTISAGQVKLELAADDIAGIQSIYGAAASVVPLPGAPILFLSALGLIGLLKRKRTVVTS